MGSSCLRSRALRLLLPLGAALCWAGLAPAQAPLAVTAFGDCPSAERVRAALGRRKLPADAAGHLLTMRAVAGGAELTLTNAASVVVVERHIESADCNALADAAALIAEAYFVEVAARAAEAPSGQASSAAPLAMPAITPATSAEPTAPPPAPASAPAPASPQPSAAEPAGNADTSRPSGLTLSLMGGADWIPGYVGAVGQLGAGWAFAKPGILLELHAMSGNTLTLGQAPDRVSRWESRGALRTLFRFGSLPIAAWAGAGAALTELQGLDLPNPPTRGHWSPLLEAGAALDEPLGGPWTVRAELGCRLLLLQEDYRVSPNEERLGEGPRIGCSLVAGLGWASDWGP